MRSLLVISTMVLLLPHLAGQQTAYPLNRLGLTVEYGIGACAITDHYISKERYSGNLRYLGVGYNRLHDGRGFRLGLMHQEGSDLENHAIRASLLRASLNFDQFFLIKEFTLFGGKAGWYIGPSVEYFEYELINRFTSSHKMMSELIMASLGFNTFLDWEITDRFTTSFFFRSNVLGVDHKTHDELRYPDKMSNLQTLFAANNILADLHARYRLLRRLSLGLSAKAQYTRSTGWDESRSFANSATAFIIIHF